MAAPRIRPGSAWGDEYLADNLRGGAAHRLGGFHQPAIHFAQGGFGHGCEEGDGRQRERHNGGGGADGGASHQAREWNDHQQDDEGQRARGVDHIAGCAA